MQSDWNSSCGDVVLDNFNEASRVGDNILYKIYNSKYVRIISISALILYNIIQCVVIRWDAEMSSRTVLL